jgi:hypothetical protein
MAEIMDGFLNGFSVREMDDHGPLIALNPGADRERNTPVDHG